MTQYQKASFLTAMIILVIFIVLASIKQSLTYLWPGLLPVFILLMTGIFAKGKQE